MIECHLRNFDVVAEQTALLRTHVFLRRETMGKRGHVFFRRRDKCTYDNDFHRADNVHRCSERVAQIEENADGATEFRSERT